MYVYVHLVCTYISWQGGVSFSNNPTGAHKGYWITPLQNGNSAAVIRFYTEINLNPRSDNSQINNSPKTKAIPNIIAHVGCPVHFIIPYADPDKDRVRCRFALDKTADDDKLDECGGLCLDRELLNASLNEVLCAVIYLQVMKYFNTWTHTHTHTHSSLSGKIMKLHFLEFL